MKLRIIASALLIVLLAGIGSGANANPWRGHHRGWYPPHPVVRVVLPPAPIVAGGYYARPHYGHRYYAQRGCGGGYYNRGYYRHCR